MIIKYPTGLYATVLPHQPTDDGNVTWTMSVPPPLLTQSFPKLPAGLENRPKQASTITPQQRRSVLGALLYSTTSTSRSVLGSNTKQYTTGQLISFVDSLPQPVVLPLPSQTTDIQHGLNQLDYTALGLSREQQAAIATASDAAYVLLQAQVAQARADYLILQVAINEDQKLVNETVTAISALQVLAAGNQAIALMINTLQTTQTTAQARITANVVAANQQTVTLNALLDQLASLAQLVE